MRAGRGASSVKPHVTGIRCIPSFRRLLCIACLPRTPQTQRPMSQAVVGTVNSVDAKGDTTAVVGEVSAGKSGGASANWLSKGLKGSCKPALCAAARCAMLHGTLHETHPVIPVADCCAQERSIRSRPRAQSTRHEHLSWRTASSATALGKVRQRRSRWPMLRRSKRQILTDSSGNSPRFRFACELACATAQPNHLDLTATIECSHRRGKPINSV